MTLFKLVFIKLVRQKSKTSLLFILISTIVIVISLAVSIRFALVATNNLALLRIPTIVTIDIDLDSAAEANGVSRFDPMLRRENIPTIRDFQNISKMHMVYTYDMYLNYSLLSHDLSWSRIYVDLTQVGNLNQQTIDFAISGLKGINPESPNDFPIKGVYNPDITDISAGLISLVAGRTFSSYEVKNAAKVAVISSAFASVNELSIGSLFQLHSTFHDTLKIMDSGVGMFTSRWLQEDYLLFHQEISFEVVGIFDVEVELNYELYSDFELLTPLTELAQLYNRIYLPITTVENIILTEHRASLPYIEQMRKRFPNEQWVDEDDEPIIQVIFVLYTPRDLQTFHEVATDLLPEFWHIVDLSGSQTHILSAFDSVIILANGVLVFGILFSILVLTLVNLFIVREQKKEVGIYIALGDSKKHVIFKFLSEIIFIASISLGIGLFIGRIISQNVAMFLINQNINIQAEQLDFISNLPLGLTLFNIPPLNIEEISSYLTSGFTFITWLLIITIVLVTIITSTIIPLIYLMRINPKKLLID